MLLIGLELLHPTLLDELNDPPRIEIDAKADAASVLGQMLDRQPKAPRARGAKHQPIRSHWKILLGKRLAEERIIGAKVVDRNAALRHAGRSAGFKHICRLACQSLGDPAINRAAP